MSINQLKNHFWVYMIYTGAQFTKTACTIRLKMEISWLDIANMQNVLLQKGLQFPIYIRNMKSRVKSVTYAPALVLPR